MKKTSKIHAIKCWKATRFEEAEESFNNLVWLKNQIAKMKSEEDQVGVEKHIENWKNSGPIVNDEELNNLLND